VLAEADHDRATLASDYDAVGVGLRYHGQRVGTLEFGHCCANGLEQVARHLEVVVHAVRDHLGVRLGGELVALALRFGAQFLVILDDAVVDDRDAVLGDVRMGVAFARHAVGRPARVRDAEATVSRVG